MRTITAFTVLVAGAMLTVGCLGTKKLEDYCNKCNDGYSEDGCKAAAKSAAKEARVLNCTKEFKDYVDCLDGLACTSAEDCAADAEKYDVCICKAGADDTSICTTL